MCEVLCGFMTKCTSGKVQHIVIGRLYHCVHAICLGVNLCKCMCGWVILCKCVWLCVCVPLILCLPVFICMSVCVCVVCECACFTRTCRFVKVIGVLLYNYVCMCVTS